MRILTDTHSLVWALFDPKRLSAKARHAMTTNDVVCSAVNLWELILKQTKPGALVLEAGAWWLKYIATPGIPALNVRVAHVLQLAGLPPIHGDPFDRMLVAQSIVEDLPIVSKDATLARYGVRIIW